MAVEEDFIVLQKAAFRAAKGRKSARKTRPFGM